MLKDEKRDISFGIKGPAHIVGDQEKIGSNPMYTEYGAAPVLIKAGVEAGEIQITAKSKGLKSGKAVTKTIPANFDLTKNKKPIYDFESIKGVQRLNNGVEEKHSLDVGLNLEPPSASLQR